VGVTPTAVTPFAEDDSLTVFDNFSDRQVGRFVDDDGAEGHAKFGRFTFAAVAIFALAVFAAFGAPVWLIFVINQVIGVNVADEYDIAPAAAIATVGSTPRFVFLAAKGHAAPTAVTGAYFDYTFVNKHEATMQMLPSLPRGVFD